MHHESKIRLIEPHTQRGGRNQRLDLIILQRIFKLVPLILIRAPRIGPHVQARLTQHLSDVLGRGNRQSINNPGTGKLPHMLHEPTQLLTRACHPQNTQT